MTASSLHDQTFRPGLARIQLFPSSLVQAWTRTNPTVFLVSILGLDSRAFNCFLCLLFRPGLARTASTTRPSSLLKPLPPRRHRPGCTRTTLTAPAAARPRRLLTCRTAQLSIASTSGRRGGGPAGSCPGGQRTPPPQPLLLLVLVVVAAPRGAARSMHRTLHG